MELDRIELNDRDLDRVFAIAGAMYATRRDPPPFDAVVAEAAVLYLHLRDMHLRKWPLVHAQHGLTARMHWDAGGEGRHDRAEIEISGTWTGPDEDRPPIRAVFEVR